MYQEKEHANGEVSDEEDENMDEDEDDNRLGSHCESVSVNCVVDDLDGNDWYVVRWRASCMMLFFTNVLSRIKNQMSHDLVRLYKKPQPRP